MPNTFEKNLKIDNIVGDNVEVKTIKTNTFESGSVLNHSVSGVTEPFNRIINLPSTVLTPGFGLFKLGQEIAVFRTALSLTIALKSKFNAIKTITDIIDNNSDLTEKDSTIAKVHSIIAERVKNRWEI